MNRTSARLLGATAAPQPRVRARLGRTLVLAGLALLAGGCSTTGSFNPAYLAAARHPASEPAAGKVLVKTSPQDDAYIYNGHPTSFTGGGTTLSLPIGTITKEAARAAFSDVFQGGADLGGEGQSGAGYRIVVAPTVTAFTYEYNQLKNVGFAITPTVTAKLHVRVLDADGNPKWERSYESGNVEGPSYMVDTSPWERIIKLAHKAIYDLLVKAANDIRVEGVESGVSTASAEGPPSH